MKIISPYLLVFLFESRKSTASFFHQALRKVEVLSLRIPFSDTGDHFKEIFKAIPYLFDLFEIIPGEKGGRKGQGYYPVNVIEIPGQRIEYSKIPHGRTCAPGFRYIENALVHSLTQNGPRF